MKNSSTGTDVQRVTFVDSLYKNLRKKTITALEKRKEIISLASAYVQDGLEDEECIELLMIDENLSRKVATSYIEMVKNSEENESEGLEEYSFQFEDVNGRVWSSHDIGITIMASSNEEAIAKAEELMCSESPIEPEKVLTVNLIS